MLALDSSDNVYVAGANNLVAVYAAGSFGNVAPMRMIAGASTKLNDPLGLSLDSAANVYVVNFDPTPGAVAVDASGDNGNVSPSRYINGRKTKLYYPEGIAVDGTGNAYVANTLKNYITVYGPESSGIPLREPSSKERRPVWTDREASRSADDWPPRLTGLGPFHLIG